MLAKERAIYSLLYRAYQFRSQIQEALGDPQAALASYQDFIKLKTFINQQNSNQIVVATLQYDFDKKETALHFQQQLTAAQLKKTKPGARTTHQGMESKRTDHAAPPRQPGCAPVTVATPRRNNTQPRQEMDSVPTKKETS